MFHWVDFPSSSMVSWDTPWIFEDFFGPTSGNSKGRGREGQSKTRCQKQGEGQGEGQGQGQSQAEGEGQGEGEGQSEKLESEISCRARFTFQWLKWPNDGWMRLMRQASIHGGKIEASQGLSWPDGLYYGLSMFKTTQRNLKTWTPSRSPSQAGKSPGISSHLYWKKHGFPLVKKKHLDADENCSSIPGNQKWYMFIFVHSAQDKHHCLKPVENWEPDGFLICFSFGWKLNQTIDDT